MDDKLFNKIQHTFTFLNNHYGRTHRDNIHFDLENYNGYFIERFKVRKGVLDVINQLEDLAFESIFNKKYKEEWHKGGTYIEGNCSVITETSIAVHWGVAEMLYYYLVNNFNDEIIKLVSVLNSEKIKNEFQHNIIVDDDEVSYHMMVNEEIDIYIRQQVPNYNQIVHVFNELSNYIYIKNSRVVFRTKAMLNALETNNRTYNFSDIKIE